MSVILAVRNSPGASSQPVPPLRLDRGEIIVGRGAGSHLLLAGQSVSRHHCTISGEAQAWRIVDASTGGTFVNGTRISGPQFLRHGDVIRVGETEIAVMLDQPAQGAPAPAQDGWGRPNPAATHVPGGWNPGPGAAAPQPAGGQDPVSLLLQSAGLSRGQVGAADPQVALVAGTVLRAALAGLVRLAQDRRKAREDLGVAAPDGVSGLDGAGSAEELLLRLLSTPPAETAAQVEALCAGIDAHQRAVLGAMQASLHHALDQFSPDAIRTSARGEAEAWKAYERAFADKDDGFVEVFAQALSKGYAEAVKQGA